MRRWAGLDAWLIGFEIIDSVEIDATSDRSFFDENYFIRQTVGVGRFQPGSLPPVAGLAVVVRASASSAQMTLLALQGRVELL